MTTPANPLHAMSTYWHEAYITAARNSFPAVTKGHELKVGWKVTLVTGESYGGYYWPLVNGYYDTPLLHKATKWIGSNHGSCPREEGDGLCLVTDQGIAKATSGVVSSLGHCVGHVLVYPADLAKRDESEKFRVPWVIDVDCFDVCELVRLGAVANLYGADLSNANLRYANLNYADLSHANLNYANLYGANLNGANLRGANLFGANLNGANLYGANLRGADLHGASLSNADLSNASLSNADLRYAKADRDTVWPAGFDAKARGVLL